MSEVQTITPEELHKKRESGKKVMLVDVRTPEEYREVRATEAKLFPLQELRADEIRKSHEAGGFDSDEPIYVICRSGRRSEQACMMLAPEGLNTVNVSGGTMEWAQRGLPTEQG